MCTLLVLRLGHFDQKYIDRHGRTSGHTSSNFCIAKLEAIALLFSNIFLLVSSKFNLESSRLFQSSIAHRYNIRGDHNVTLI